MNETTLVLLAGPDTTKPQALVPVHGAAFLLWQPGRLDSMRDPYALRPVVADGLPCSECFRGRSMAKPMPGSIVLALRTNMIAGQFLLYGQMHDLLQFAICLT
jgi:hypothetical protein